MSFRREQDVSENGAVACTHVYVERCPRIERVVGSLFEGEEAVLHVIERIVAPLGLRVDATVPWVDARLPDGSRVQTRFLGTLVGPRASYLPPSSAARCRSDFPASDFEDSRADLVLDAAAPLERLPEAIPERPQVANPRSI